MKNFYKYATTIIQISLIIVLFLSILDWDKIFKKIGTFKIEDLAKATEIVKRSGEDKFLETATPNKIKEKAESIEIYNHTYKPLRWFLTVPLFFLAFLYYVWKGWELGLLFGVLALLKIPLDSIKIQGMTHQEWNFIDISLIVFSIVLIILIWITDRKNPNSIQEAPKEIQKEK